MRAVDVVKGSEGGDAAVDRHGMSSQLALCREEKPMWVRSRHKDALVVLNVFEVPETNWLL